MDQREQKAIDNFQLLFTSHISLDELADHLDDAIWKLTDYMLTDPLIKGHLNNADELFTLKRIRDICRGRNMPL